MAETGNMVAANPFLQKNMPTMPGNIGIGYAQGGLNIGTQAKETERLDVEKQEGATSQANLNSAKAELARQQALLQQRTAEKAQKENERSAAQARAQAATQALSQAQQQLASAQSRIAQASQAISSGESERDRMVAAARNSAPPPPASINTPLPKYTFGFEPEIDARGPAPLPPSYQVTFGNPVVGTGNSGSASSVMNPNKPSPQPAANPFSGMSQEDINNFWTRMGGG